MKKTKEKVKKAKKKNSKYLHMAFNIKKVSRKGILEFDLDEPFSKESFENAIRADEYASKIQHFYDSVTRPYLKYGNLPGLDKELSDNERAVLDHLCELAHNYIYDKE